MYYPNMFHEELRKDTKDLSQSGLASGRDACSLMGIKYFLRCERISQKHLYEGGKIRK
jgi:hypothetical protein